MVNLPKKKVGIVACSGEELSEGTVTRLAALQVLEQLRPSDTVTICLPLFLAGGEGDRAFARFYPTISVDGCELRCAAKATEKYSNKPAKSIVVRDLIEENQLDKPGGRRRVNSTGIQAVEVTAQQIVRSVDELLSSPWNRKLGELIQLETINEAKTELAQNSNVATCSCGSRIPVQDIIMAGKQVTVLGLPLIFQQFSEAGKAPGEANLDELMEMIKLYNPICEEQEAYYREGIKKAYTDFWFKEKKQ
jgi:uncharacterized metal-binding protein